jgi:hypothetical protein
MWLGAIRALTGRLSKFTDKPIALRKQIDELKKS